MILDLDANFCIEADDYNFHLCRKVLSKSGKSAGQQRLEIVAYCYRLEHALDTYFQRALKETPAVGLAQLLEALAHANANITRVGQEFMTKFPPRLAKPVTPGPK